MLNSAALSLGRPDPWRAVSIKDLWQRLGYEVATSLKQQWEVAMGTGGYPSRAFDYGVRSDSLLIVPTRTVPVLREVVGEPAFRLPNERRHRRPAGLRGLTRRNDGSETVNRSNGRSCINQLDQFVVGMTV